MVAAGTSVARHRVAASAPVALSLALLAGGLSSPPASAEESPTALAAIGKKVFFDPSLSASGRMSCATCHDPAHAYGPPDGSAVRRAAGT